MNALVKQDTRTAIASADAYDPFAIAGEEMGGSNAQYLKFNGNSGEYTYGAEAEEMPHGTQLAVNMNSFRRGFICWKDSDVVDEVMVRVIDGKPPEKGELRDHGPYIQNDERKDGWAEQSAVEFRALDTGKAFTFKVSSVSAIRALGTLLKDYATEYKAHPGELAVVELGASSFIPKNKQWGKKHSPKLKIVGWIAEAELNGQSGDNPDDYADAGGEPAPGIDSNAAAKAEEREHAGSKAADPAPAKAAGSGPRRRF